MVRVFTPSVRNAAYIPFLDLRFGYIAAYNTYSFPNDIYGNPAFVQTNNTGFNDGFGGVAGAGFELALTRRFSLTTAASLMRSDISAHGYNAQIPLKSSRYWMSSYRYTLGLRYNPVRLLTDRRTPSDLNLPFKAA